MHRDPVCHRLFIVCAVLVALGSSLAHAAAYNVPVAQDVHSFYDWEWPDVNPSKYIADHQDLRVYTYYLQGYRSTHQYTYLTFDLSALPDNLAAGGWTTLYIHCRSVNSVAPILYHVADDSWFDGPMTWDNQPGGSIQIVDTAAWPANVTNQWIALPLNSNWDYQADLLDDALSMKIVPGASSTPGSAYFDSMEYANGDFAAYLVVMPAPAALPAGLALLGAIMLRRRVR